MSVSGRCQICGTATAEFRCSSCGSLVCADHFVHGAGLCTDCAGPGAGHRI